MTYVREILRGWSPDGSVAVAVAALRADCIAAAVVHFLWAGLNFASLRLASRVVAYQEQVLRKRDVCSRVPLSMWLGGSTNHTDYSSTWYLLRGYSEDVGGNCAK